ncbi:MAG: NAD-glutamate dehydrogenase [Gammaproteobacteria bacterium]|jgi:glutamate dehydrogenase
MKNRIAEIIAEVTPGKSTNELPRTARNHFLSAYYARVPPEELMERLPRDLAGAAITHLALAVAWRRGDYRVRVFNPSLKSDGWESTHTIVQAVTLNRPYLVDTLTMVINELGFANHIVIHPIVGIKRGAARKLTGIAQNAEAPAGFKPESFIHIEIDRETDAARLEDLQTRIEQSLQDVAAAVEDWPNMLDRIGTAAATIGTAGALPSDAVRNESAAFLHWVLAGNMTVLGVRDYKLAQRGETQQMCVEPGSGLGILRDDERTDVSIDIALSGSARRSGHDGAEAIVLLKSDSRSTVHRADYLDYIGIRQFDHQGKLIGELRILGLYTSAAYIESPRAIPIVRQKLQAVMRNVNTDAQSHDGRAIMHILDTYPRAELFEAEVDDITQTALGIVQLQERQRVRVFIRADRLGRYYACQIYVPRDHFDTGARHRIQEILIQELHGERVDFTVNVSEVPLARLYMVVHCLSRSARRVSGSTIEKRIAAAVRPWTAALQAALMAAHGEEAGLDQFKQFAKSFPAAYRDDHPASEAVEDIPFIEASAHDSRIRAHIVASAADKRSFVFKLYSPDRIVEVSRILPILENMGVSVQLEHPYEISLDDDRRLWIHDYECTLKSELDTIGPALRHAFNDVVSAVWYGDVENDQLNELVLTTRLSARRITILRAYGRYLRQTNAPYGLGYINSAIAGNPAIAQRLADLFDARFTLQQPEQRAREQAMAERLESLLDDVASLDEDRILRTIYRMILATVRTNYYQSRDDGSAKPYLSLKFLPEHVPGLPDPKPAFEIFVYSPAVEGVHLRGGKVARGGLRWSDRPEDYRTEVLGLMKAQSVKNAVIVPVGAKGGFVAKLPAIDRAARLRQGVECYRTFIRGLLDLTDNYIGGEISPPADTVRHDDDDPYLVVAADKGTATFSDIANELSAEYGFWLGDAFASGGSDGYDHKKMGITARGAWESVRHLGDILGLDVNRDEFTVVGIGDMSGDVFGNGMLLSRHIRLIAAFNHEHIFIDPNPDPKTSLAERRRLFRLRGSRWTDYDSTKISAGGGVYARSAKSIVLGSQARATLDIDAEKLAPDELVSAILRAPVDLLWNGGIGTYAKATAERDEDVGDKSNDRVRVNATELRCRMIGEGGNLGFTQAARSEFAAAGGLVNADWIDNSAGVDCSDHEVNIKILLNRIATAQRLSLTERNTLLKAMQKEVGASVLANNHAQARTISYDEIQSREHIDWYRFTITQLEQDAGMNRRLEMLPQDGELRAREEAGEGLHRPELAVLVAWAKIAIFRELTQSKLVHDPHLDALALHYFPHALRETYAAAVREHPLRDEIIATTLAGQVVDRMGITFATRLTGETGIAVEHVVRSWIIVYEGLGLNTLWDMIDSAGSGIGFDARCDMILHCRRVAKNATRWLIRNLPASPIGETIAALSAVRDEFCTNLERLLSTQDAERLHERRQQLAAAGVPQKLARAVAAAEFLPRVLPLAEAARRANVSFDTAATCYAELDAHVPFSTVYGAIDNLPAADVWADRARVEAAALASALHIELTETAFGDGGTDSWVSDNGEKITRLAGICRELEAASEPDLAKVLVLLNQMKTAIQTY